MTYPPCASDPSKEQSQKEKPFPGREKHLFFLSGGCLQGIERDID